MKLSSTLKLIFIAQFLAIIVGCYQNSSYEEEHESREFKIHFKSAEFKKVPYGSVYAISYLGEGELVNNSDMILESAFIKLNIKFVLKNGNVIGNSQLDPAAFLVPSYSKYIKRSFVPKDKVDFSLSSPRIVKEYRSYPIQKVYISYIISGKNPENGIEYEEMIKQVDVTSEWSRFLQEFDDKSSDDKIDVAKLHTASSSFKRISYKAGGNEFVGLMPSDVFCLNYSSLLDSLRRADENVKEVDALAEDELIGYTIRTNEGEYFLDLNNNIASYSYSVNASWADVLKFYTASGAIKEYQELNYVLLALDNYKVVLSDLGDRIDISLNKK